jgi:hypothetical protein
VEDLVAIVASSVPQSTASGMQTHGPGATAMAAAPKRQCAIPPQLYRRAAGAD